MQFYGPYRVVERVSKVAYQLELLEDSCMHPIFHVSLLNCFHGLLLELTPPLPSLVEASLSEPSAIIDQQFLRVDVRSCSKCQWSGTIAIEKMPLRSCGCSWFGCFPTLTLRPRSFLLTGINTSEPQAQPIIDTPVHDLEVATENNGPISHIGPGLDDSDAPTSGRRTTRMRRVPRWMKDFHI